VSGEEVVVWALLGIGVGATLLSVLGVLVAGSVYDRLHYNGPATILGPVTIAAAVVIQFGALSQAGLKSMLAAFVLLTSSSVLVHATARAARIRERGRFDPASEASGERE
jgi:multisubunit Na+/H+ antiporter MnhG subunit